MSARLRTGDLVIVISGKDKNKTGKIRRIFRDEEKVIVEGVNMVKRHTKPLNMGTMQRQGGIVQKEAPIFASKVMLVDPKTGKGTRVRMQTDDKGNKVRIAVKSGQEIPYPKRGE